MVRSIPHDDKALEVLASLEKGELLALHRSSKLNPRMTLVQLQELAARK